MPTKLHLAERVDHIIYQKKDNIKVNPFKIIVENEGPNDVTLNFLKIIPNSTAVGVFDGETIHAISEKGATITFDFDFS